LPGRNPAAVATGLVEFFTKNDLGNQGQAPRFSPPPRARSQLLTSA
jgi:hypothetical protein